MHNILKKAFYLILRGIAPFLYDRKYLRGKHFDNGNTTGWSWVWKAFWFQKILRFNTKVPWPVGTLSHISDPNNIVFDVDDLNNFQSSGCYFQNFSGKITLGKGTYIAPNVGIITANHDISNLEEHLPGKDVFIGEECWIGMNSVILPGIYLGPRTIVGAGSIVTQSFPEGNCIVAGSPAKMIKYIEV